MNITKGLNRVSAVIPFFNEEKTIKEIVTRSLNYVDEVIAVNDGSTDNSVLQLNDIKRFHLINIPENKGKGLALQMGFQYSCENNFNITITLDADLQHDPDYIPSLISLIPEYDIVIGNRLNNLKPMPLQRRLSNKITSGLLSHKLKVRIKDSQSGFRAYRTDILPRIKTKSTGFEAESEILVNASRNNYKIGSVDIPTIYGDEKSKVNSLKAIKGFIRIMLS